MTYFNMAFWQALLEKNTYFPASCACVASRELPLQCDYQLLVGPVSQSAASDVCGTALPALSPLLYYICALQGLAAYLATVTLSQTPIDGIRPTSTSTGTLKPSSSGRPNCSLHCNPLCKEVATSALGKLFHLPLTTHCAEPENALVLLKVRFTFTLLKSKKYSNPIKCNNLTNFVSFTITRALLHC